MLVLVILCQILFLTQVNEVITLSSKVTFARMVLKASPNMKPSILHSTFYIVHLFLYNLIVPV